MCRGEGRRPAEEGPRLRGAGGRDDGRQGGQREVAAVCAGDRGRRPGLVVGMQEETDSHTRPIREARSASPRGAGLCLCPFPCEHTGWL